MNIHKVDNIYKAAWGIIYNPVKFWLFMKTGYYNGEHVWKWRRLFCLFGIHEYETYGFYEVKENLVIEPICHHCGLLARWEITPTFMHEVKDILERWKD